jgi:hypothetical protein
MLANCTQWELCIGISAFVHDLSLYRLGPAGQHELHFENALSDVEYG